MKACLRTLQGQSGRRSSVTSLRRPSRSHSPSQGVHQRAPSEPADLFPPYTSPTVSSPGAMRTYSSRSSASSHSDLPMAVGVHVSGASVSAAHQLSPSHCTWSRARSNFFFEPRFDLTAFPNTDLQRRRSEEEREPRRKGRRPSLAPRSITFQPDTASPLAVDEGYPVSLSHHHPALPPLLRKLSTETDLSSSGSPSSPGSIVSLSDGGSALKSSAVVAKEREEEQTVERVPRVLVVEGK